MNAIEYLIAPKVVGGINFKSDADIIKHNEEVHMNVVNETLTKGVEKIPYANTLWENLKAEHTISDLIPDLILYQIQQITKAQAAKHVKVKKIEGLLNPLGIYTIGVGTNRMALQCIFNPKYVVKVALDFVGIQDSPREMRNQEWLKPFCTKIYEVTPCGTIALVEAVVPIKRKVDFDLFFPMIVKTLLCGFILTRFAMDDIGFENFMNYGVREGFGPVLLDFPYLYGYDWEKMTCSNILEDGTPCNGEIDYEMGFMYFVCPKCGQIFTAAEVGKPLYDKHHIFEEVKNNKSDKILLASKNNTLDPPRDYKVTVYKDGVAIVGGKEDPMDYSNIRVFSYQKKK